MGDNAAQSRFSLARRLDDASSPFVSIPRSTNRDFCLESTSGRMPYSSQVQITVHSAPASGSIPGIVAFSRSLAMRLGPGAASTLAPAAGLHGSANPPVAG